MRKRKENKAIRKIRKINNIDIVDDKNDDEEFLAAIESSSSKKMWVQRSKYSDDDNNDIDGSSDALWILIGDEDSENDNDNDTKHKQKRHGVVLKLTFDDEIDDWVAKKATKSEELDFIQSDGHPLEEWIPIEGVVRNI